MKRATETGRQQAREDTIALLRSGRHLDTALAALRRARPASRVIVVSQPGTDRLLEAAGIPETDRLYYEDSRFFSPWRFQRSEAGRAVRHVRPSAVAVLWNDPNGEGQENVNLTALTIRPAGFLAVTPDGSVRRCRSVQLLGVEATSAVSSIAVHAAVWLLLSLPASVLRMARR